MATGLCSTTGVPGLTAAPGGIRTAGLIRPTHLLGRIVHEREERSNREVVLPGIKAKASSQTPIMAKVADQTGGICL